MMVNKMRLAFLMALLICCAQEVSAANPTQLRREELMKSLEEKAQEERRGLRHKTKKQQEGLITTEERKARDLQQSKLHFRNVKRDPSDAIVFGDYVIFGDRTGLGHLYTTSDLSYSHVLYTSPDLSTTSTIEDGTKIVALTAPDHGSYDVSDHIWQVLPAPSSAKNNGDLVVKGDLIELYNIRNGFYLAENSNEAPYNVMGCQVFGSGEESDLTSWLVRDVTLDSNGELIPGQSGVVLANVKSFRILAALNRIDSDLNNRYPVATRSFTISRRKRDMNALFYVVRRATQVEIDNAIGI